MTHLPAILEIAMWALMFMGLAFGAVIAILGLAMFIAGSAANKWDRRRR